MTNGQKSHSGVRNPACCYSKPCKMETNDPRDLKSDLKKSLEYPLCDQRSCQKFFFQSWGLKGLLFFGAPFRPLIGCVFGPSEKNWRLFRPQFSKKSGNVFDHKEDTLGIIISSISGLSGPLFQIYKALSNGTMGK